LSSRLLRLESDLNRAMPTLRLLDAMLGLSCDLTTEVASTSGATYRRKCAHPLRYRLAGNWGYPKVTNAPSATRVILNHRVRRELRRPNRSWRVDETYIKVAGNRASLYRAVDSTRETIEFMLSPKTRPGRCEAVPARGTICSRTAAASNQRRWACGLCERDCRTEAVRRTRPALSLPNRAVCEQHHRAGSSSHQEAVFSLDPAGNVWASKGPMPKPYRSSSVPWRSIRDMKTPA
jgi:hypothetical protein